MISYITIEANSCALLVCQYQIRARSNLNMLYLNKFKRLNLKHLLLIYCSLFDRYIKDEAEREGMATIHKVKIVYLKVRVLFFITLTEKVIFLFLV